MVAEQYRDKLVSADEAVRIIKSGDWVDYGICLGHPVAADAALAARAPELSGVKVRGAVSMRLPAICTIPDPGRHFTWNTWHCTGVDRKILQLGCGYFSPMRYSELPRFYRENIEKVDTAIFQVPPMDDRGYFNFGPQGSHLKAVCDRADNIIVEVNENMPRCVGDEHAVHVSQVRYVVEGENPSLPELKPAAPTAVDRKVAELILEDIPNGACLQLGIGDMPTAVGMLIAESDLRDLGVHTELYTDVFVDLSLQGKITGAKKNIDRYRQVYTFALGTQRLYDFINDNPQMLCRSAEYTNDVHKVAQLDNFISINNAIEVDLFGQVSSESSGTKHISGTGGQLDFVTGAYLSRGGKSFICLSSTYGKNGSAKSRIVPTLPTGSIVTAPRSCTHWVVTEFGKVNLKGLSTWERAEALISVAHPDFRDELIRQAEEMNIWRNSNRI